jgi:hypothetical protein
MGGYLFPIAFNAIGGPVDFYYKCPKRPKHVKVTLSIDYYAASANPVATGDETLEFIVNIP